MHSRVNKHLEPYSKIAMTSVSLLIMGPKLALGPMTWVSYLNLKKGSRAYLPSMDKGVLSQSQTLVQTKGLSFTFIYKTIYSFKIKGDN